MNDLTIIQLKNEIKEKAREIESLRAQREGLYKAMQEKTYSYTSHQYTETNYDYNIRREPHQRSGQ